MAGGTLAAGAQLGSDEKSPLREPVVIASWQYSGKMLSVDAQEPQPQLKIEHVPGAESLLPPLVDKELLAPSSKGLAHHIASGFSSRTNTHTLGQRKKPIRAVAHLRPERFSV